MALDLEDYIAALKFGALLGVSALSVTNSEDILDSNGNEMLGFSVGASAVNNFKIGNSNTGGSPFLQAVGDDAAVDVGLVPKGTGSVRIGTGSAAGLLESFGNNDLILKTGNATSSSIVITDGAGGDITFDVNGAGRVQFGLHSGLAAETLSGYITMKDAGGTSRKIGIIS